jgi:opacity protein-like surface antigen
MQKTIVSALAVLASMAAASAADLPSKAAPASPLPAFAAGGYYAGVNVGANADSARVYSGGAVAGWNVLPFLAVEGTYDLSRPQAKVNREYNWQNTVAVNAVPQYKVPGTDITAYAVGGIGYRWNSVSTVADHSVYNIGGGLKYEFAKNLELDGRYRRIDGLQKKDRTSTSSEDRVTFGVNYKF